MVDGEYVPSTSDWVADQVAAYEASGGTEANTLRDTGIPIIIFTTRGHKTGKVRKVPLMRVEHEGSYALVASRGGAPSHPSWYHNLMADPDIMLQDGPEPFATTTRLVTGEERKTWWDRAVAVFPTYARYEIAAGDREIPLFVTEPSSD